MAINPAPHTLPAVNPEGSEQGEWALVTGATSGIGKFFALELAAQGRKVILVARTQSGLSKTADLLRQQYGVQTEILSADLAISQGQSAVASRISRGDVNFLVNNAGFGILDPLDESSWEDEHSALEVMVATPIRLSQAFATARADRGGQIINVASVAGFLPRGSYGATKAAIISFTRWFNTYFAPQGINSTAVCPGFVRTQFHLRMGQDMSKVPRLLWTKPETVISAAFSALAKKKSVVIPGFVYKVVVFFSRIAPKALVEKLGRRK